MRDAQDILDELNDALIELEEGAEYMDLEDRLELALLVADLQDEHLRATLRETGGL